jgi:hypothetical protein
MHVSELFEGFSGNQYNDLLKRALAEFDRQKDKIATKLAPGTKFNKSSFTIPIGEGSFGGIQSLTVTFWKEAPKRMTGGGFAKEDSRKSASWQDMRIEMRWSPDMARNRRIFAHEVTHIPQIMKGWAYTDHDTTDRAYEKWAKKRGEEPIEQKRRYGRMHSAYSSEHEAELGRLFTMLHDGEIDAVVKDLLIVSGPYMQFERKAFIKKAVSYGITAETLGKLKQEVQKVVTNLTTMGQRFDLTKQAMVGFEMMSNICAILDIDITSPVNTTFDTFEAGMMARIAAAGHEGQAKRAEWDQAAIKHWRGRVNDLLANDGRLDRFYKHHRAWDNADFDRDTSIIDMALTGEGLN